MLARLCRMSACASLTSAPAIFSQVANERRSTCQFTHGIPSFRAAGYSEARQLKDRLRPQLVRMIQNGKLINEAHIERWVRQQVENS